ncbi:MAG: hypothetical protein K5922_07190 [Clostridiales bacterium]|nr:hypothetical protein [Clostridiales bacterium]
MFDFFDNQKNPFLTMMNMFDKAENAGQGQADNAPFGAASQQGPDCANPFNPAAFMSMMQNAGCPNPFNPAAFMGMMQNADWSNPFNPAAFMGMPAGGNPYFFQMMPAMWMMHMMMLQNMTMVPLCMMKGMSDLMADLGGKAADKDAEPGWMKVLSDLMAGSGGKAADKDAGPGWMKVLSDLMASPGGKPADKASEGGKNMFMPGGMNLPPELLQMLMQLEMSPENLRKLQKVLDFVFGILFPQKDEPAAQPKTK